MTHSLTPADTIIAYTHEDGFTCVDCLWQIDTDTDEFTPVFADADVDGVACDTCDWWINGVAALEHRTVNVDLVDAWGDTTSVCLDLELPVLGGWIATRERGADHFDECVALIVKVVDRCADKVDEYVADWSFARSGGGVWGGGAFFGTLTVFVGDAFTENAEGARRALANALINA